MTAGVVAAGVVAAGVVAAGVVTGAAVGAEVGSSVQALGSWQSLNIEINGYFPSLQKLPVKSSRAVSQNITPA